MHVVWSAYGALPQQAHAIREEVFVRKQGFQEEFDTVDQTAYHALLMHDEQAVGTARLFEEAPGCMHIGRVAVRKAARSGGSGSILLRACWEQAKALGAQRVILGAQCRAKHFYESNGFHCYGDLFLDEGCEHIMMEKQL